MKWYWKLDVWQHNFVHGMLTLTTVKTPIRSLQWHHNERNDVSNHRRLDCLLSRSGTDQRKHLSSASLAFVRGIHWWPVEERASNAENISIWWRHHVVSSSFMISVHPRKFYRGSPRCLCCCPAYNVHWHYCLYCDHKYAGHFRGYTMARQSP